MVRRPIAVVLACLYALGGACAVPASAASRAPGGLTGAALRASPATRPDACLARHTVPKRRHGRAHGATQRRHGVGGLTHAPEPREPGPDEVARMSADLARRLGTATPREPTTPRETAQPRDAAQAAVTPPPGVTARPGSGVGDRRVGSGTVERITVPVWVHIIKDHALGLPDAAVSRQITALNTAYSGGYGGADTGVRFELKGITHTENRSWFRDPLGYEEPMKKKLRVGGPETLNLYIAQLSRLVLGYSTYPYWYDDEPVLDGVVIDWRSVPGGPLRDFARGFTAVHEIGHWLGLLHTFENGCKAPGDSVDDTPAEAYPTNGCPAKKDTCPAQGGDPIRNFMDYAQDRCMREFTAGQGVRVHQMWDAYRRPGPQRADAGLHKAAAGAQANAAKAQADAAADGADAPGGIANDLANDDTVSDLGNDPAADAGNDTVNDPGSGTVSDPVPGLAAQGSDNPAGNM
ncbi:zinc metalloprotease [Microbispora rosea]|uniref:zinc metalloprotease n=1 Tax=Microbispora rosea TaxID=58117 RepID=UPI0037B970CA